jgi:hypothetical protein
LNARKAFLDLRDHILSQLEAHITGFLVRGQLLIPEVLSKTGAYLKCVPEACGGVTRNPTVIEALDEVVSRQCLMPHFHEVVTNVLLAFR